MHIDHAFSYLVSILSARKYRYECGALRSHVTFDIVRGNNVSRPLRQWIYAGLLLIAQSTIFGGKLYDQIYRIANNSSILYVNA